MDTTAQLRSWQRRIFVTCWLTYASFYLCRVNLSVTLPAIQGEFGWSKAEVGLIGAGVSGLLIGAIVDAWGWDAVFVCWAVVAVLGVAATLPLLRNER